MRFLKQGTAVTIEVGPFLKPSDLSEQTALTSQTGRIVKAGVSTALTPASWSHVAGGSYAVGLSTSHTDTVGRGRLVFQSSADYLPVIVDFTVLSLEIYDWMFGATAPITSITDSSGVTDLLARLTTTRAGNLDKLDQPISSRLAASAYAAPDNTAITAIKAKTDNLPPQPAAKGDVPTAAANASAVRTNLATELGRIDADITSRLAAGNVTLASTQNFDNTGQTTAQPADLTRFKGGDITTVSAPVDVNVTQVDGQTASATGTVDFDAIGTGGGGEGGASPWTTADVKQARYRLGIDGDAITPSTAAPNLPLSGTDKSAIIDGVVNHGDVSWKTATGFATAADIPDPLTAAQTRDALGMASANMDTQLGAILSAAGSGGGGGEADWTSEERQQIRYRLGVDGDATAPVEAEPNLPVDVSSYATDMSPAEQVLATPANKLKTDTDGRVEALIAGVTDGVTFVTVPTAAENATAVWSATLDIEDDGGSTAGDTTPIKAIRRLYRRFFRPADKTDNALRLKSNAGAVVSTQPITDDGQGNETQGAAS